MPLPPHELLDLERESSQLNELQEHDPQPDDEDVQRDSRLEGEQPEHE
jgi:hypothetical protein